MSTSLCFCFEVSLSLYVKNILVHVRRCLEVFVCYRVQVCVQVRTSARLCVNVLRCVVNVCVFVCIGASLSGANAQLCLMTRMLSGTEHWN